MLSKKRFLEAFVRAMPLTLSIAPWGVLCGSLAIQNGLSVWQSQLMSLIIFAGAAQISALSIIAAGGGLGALMSSTFMINSRCMLYSASLKDQVRVLPFWKRALFAFVLVDQTFILSIEDQERNGRFDYDFSLASGWVLYFGWNISTFIGIMVAHSVDNIQDLGLDFIIVCVFVAMTVPRIKQRSVLISVVVSGFISLILTLLGVKSALIIAGVVGMLTGYWLSQKGEIRD